MNIIRKSLLIIAATMSLAIGLTGCVPSDESNYENDSVTYSAPKVEPVLIYVNQETSRITKFVDSDGVEQFNEGYSSKDKEIEAGSASRPPEKSITLTGRIDIEGQPQLVSSRLNWQLSQSSIDMIPFYNENMANEPFGTAPTRLNTESIQLLVADYVANKISDAIAAGQLPTVHYELNGKSTITTDVKVAQAHANGNQPWVAYQAINGGSVTTDQHYSYVYDCATYGYSTDGNELASALTSMFPNYPEVFKVYSGDTEVNISTAAPCGIIADTLYNPDGDFSGYPTQPPSAPRQNPAPPSGR